MRKFWIAFSVIAVIVLGVLTLLWRAVGSLDDPGPVKGSVLHWQAAGGYPENPPAGFVEQLQAGDALTHHQLLFSIKRAATDPAVEALVLELRGVALDWAQLEELHEAVLRFRQTGKTVWAHVAGGGNADYALATAAHRIAMAPEGQLAVLGVVAELAFLRDTLDMLGLAADFVHVGRYKSAPEQLTRTAPSDANREMTTSLVEARYRLLIDLIARGRGCDPDSVRGWIDVGLFDAEAALAAGLVDTLLDDKCLLEEIYPREEVCGLEAYARRHLRGKPRQQVALVVAAGTIVPGESRYDNLQGRFLGSDTVVDQLARARRDKKIGAVVLRVSSPGGSALASDLIWREVARLREVKPVIVSMGGYAASGGYYIACGADSIFADAATLTGSIGVFAGKLDWSGLYDKLGVRREFITRGENALFWHDAGEFTPAQRALLQAQLDRFYERFLAKVAQGRSLAGEQVAAAAQGRVWTGDQALAHGLIDGLGGLDRALLSVKHILGLAPEEPLRVRIYTKELSWFERSLLGFLRSGGGALAWHSSDCLASLATLPAPLGDLAVALAQTGLTDVLPLLDGQPLALLPWRDVPGQGSVSRP